MRYVSTRGSDEVSLDTALVEGIAADGGLFVPTHLPTFPEGAFSASKTITDVAKVILQPFFEGSLLEADLEPILAETYSFPIVARPLAVAGGASVAARAVSRADRGIQGRRRRFSRRLSNSPRGRPGIAIDDTRRYVGRHWRRRGRSIR